MHGTTMRWGVLALVALAAGTGCETDQAVTTPSAGTPDALEARTIVVAIGGTENTVDLSLLTATPADDGTPRVRMADVLTAAGGTDLGSYRCDFVADDGFRTSSKGADCPTIPCDQTAEAWIAVTTRDVSWSPTVTMGGCYQPHALARIEMSPAS